MANMKADLIKKMTDKVEEINKAKATVTALAQEVLDAEDVAQEALTAIEEELAQVEADKAEATDLTTAKALSKKAQEIAEDIELQIGVNKAVKAKKLEELDESIVELLKAHKTARFIYTSVENEFTATVSLRSLKEDTATLQGFANAVNGALDLASRMLVNHGFITQGESSRTYKGHHLGATPVFPNLDRVFNPDARRGY